MAINTQGVRIAVYRQGGTAPLAEVVAALGPSSPNCSPTNEGQSCAIPIFLSPGDDDFVITTYDQPPSGGSFPAYANELAYGAATVDIAHGQANSISVTLGGIVASTLLTLPSPSIYEIPPSTQNATVEALDPDGNVIVSDQYVDANGNPVTIAVSPDSAAGSTISITPTTFSSPPPAVKVHYSPGGLTTGQFPNGFSTVLTASASNGATPGSATLTVGPPQVTEFPVPAGGAGAITAGSDGALWFVTTCGVGRIPTTATPSAPQVEQFPLPQVGYGIAEGPDGAIWFTETTDGKIGRIPTTATPTSLQLSEFTIPTANSYPLGIAAGPDGALWFTESNADRIGRVQASATSSAQVSDFPVPTASAFPAWITAGADGAMWFTEENTSSIGRVPTTATSAAPGIREYLLPDSINDPQAIVPAKDRAVWFSYQSQQFPGMSIGRLAVGSGTAIQDGPSMFNAQINGIAVGADGALWYTDSFNQVIGRITIDGAVSQIPLSTGSILQGISAGSDGAIWFTDGNSIGRIR